MAMIFRNAFAVFAVSAMSAHAATFTVMNNSDSGAGSLRDAIAQANGSAPPNSIHFDPGVTGSIVLTTGQIQISKAMSIVGPGAANLTIDGNASSRIFSIFVTDPACPTLDGPDYLVSISGLRLTNAHRTTSNSAGAIFTEHSLTLDAMTVDNNVAGSGGGVSFEIGYTAQSLTITNSQFLNNSGQPLNGPGVSFGGALAIFEKCAATHTKPVPITIANSVFSGNKGLPNTLNAFGGAIASDSSADITITDTRIINNTVTVPNPPVANQIYRAGGLYAHAKTLNIVRSEIAGNSVVDVTGADVTRAGGLHLFNIDADTQGPADLFSAKIINSTISGNSSSATAGAVFVFGNVALELDNSTVNGNLAPATRTGGIVISTGATNPPSANNATTPTMTLISSILANNQGSGGDVATSVATIPTFTINATKSLIETICPSPGCVIAVSGSGNLPTGTNPMVGPLAFNGGTTRTHALLAGSPAINAGSNPLALATDQRGGTFARVVGAAADMGAYEFTPGTTPTFQSAVSRKVHGAAGTFDLPLGLVSTNPTTEPRTGPAQTIVMTFDRPINAATATISEGTATAATPTFSGNSVIVALTGVVNQQYVTVALSSVASTDGGTGGSGSVRVGFLAGDVNQNRVVTLADLGLVNAQLAQSVTASNYLKDVNASGTLTLADKGITNANLAKALPAP
jgi:hypothetical protein